MMLKWGKSTPITHRMYNHTNRLGSGPQLLLELVRRASAVAAAARVPALQDRPADERRRGDRDDREGDDGLERGRHGQAPSASPAWYTSNDNTHAAPVM